MARLDKAHGWIQPIASNYVPVENSKIFWTSLWSVVIIFIWEIRPNPQQLISAKIPQLCPKIRDLLNRSIPLEEINMAINVLKTGSALGLDGFASEYYKHYEGILDSPLLSLFNYIVEGSPLPPS